MGCGAEVEASVREEPLYKCRRRRQRHKYLRPCFRQIYDQRKLFVHTFCKRPLKTK